MFVVPVLNMWLHSQNVRKRSAQIRQASINSMQHAIGRPAAAVVQHEDLAPAPKQAAAPAIAAGAADSGGTTIELAALQQQQQQRAAYRSVSDAYGVLKPDQDVASATSSCPASKPGIIPTLQVSTASGTAMSCSSASSPTATINSASPFIPEQAVPSQAQPGAISAMSATAAGAATAAAPSAGVSPPNTLGDRINSASGRLFRRFFDHHLLDDGDVPRLLSTSEMHSPQSIKNFNLQHQQQQPQQQQKQQHRPARSMSMLVRRSDGVLQSGGAAAAGAGAGAQQQQQQQFQRRSFKFWHTDIIMVRLKV
jgi:hypothetical protein